eukprot:Gb_37074 [translate_table: standard]
MTTWSRRDRNKSKLILSVLHCVGYQKLFSMNRMVQRKTFKFQIYTPEDAATPTKAHSSNIIFGDGRPC